MIKVATVCLVSSIFWMQVHAECDLEHWQRYKADCKKSYPENEEESRMLIFIENCERVNKHNIMYDNNEVSFKTKINCRTSDATLVDLKKMLGSYKGFKTPGSEYTPKHVTPPKSFDWRTKVNISSVKDQGDCASSWAMITVDAIQNLIAIKTNTTVTMSSQELLDCTGNCENHGCYGGRTDIALKYIKEKGISLYDEYPYTGKVGSCQKGTSVSQVKICDYLDIADGNDLALKQTLITYGPVITSVDASSWSFWEYCEGIYDEDECSCVGTTMAMMVIGYGEENGKGYWLCKSALGTDWGDNGYIKMSMDNSCGVSNDASIPVLC